MSPRSRLVAAALLSAGALVAARPAAACSACNCGDTTLTVSGLEKPYKNRVRLALDERVSEATSGDNSTWTLRSALQVSWSPSSRVTLGAMLPWVTTWLREPNQPLATINGLGDLELAARVVLFRERRFAPHHLLWGTGGLKFPTAPRLIDNDGHPYSDDDQPGSGSWDPFTSLSYGWFGNNVSLFGSAGYRYNTVGPRGYRRGSVLAVTTAAQVAPWSWGALSVGVDGIWAQADSLPNGNDMPNTGGFSLHITPSLLVTPVVDLLLRLAVSIPAVNVLYGVQTEGPQVLLSLVYDLR